MIDVFEALDWLNEFSVSNLTSAVQIMTVMSRDVAQSDEQKQAMINNLLGLANVSRNAFEVAEINLHCSALEYWRGSYREAIGYARQATRTYRADRHRKAIARWILGMASWQIGENNVAYRNWDAARRFVKNTVIVFKNSPSSRDWYEECLRRMEIDLATKPEQVYWWLNKYEPSNLSAPAQVLKDQIIAAINQRNIPAIDRLCSQLQDITRRSRELYECAEADLECGFAYYQIGRTTQAIDSLQSAVQKFAPGMGDNHKQVMALWMLGAVEWMGNAEQNRQARLHWIQCINEIEILRLTADRANKQKQKRWYANRRATLQSTLAMYLTK